ncbi:MAG TPA: YrrS family protein [Bacillota bacterium]|nr:YrrS family protein [Bacillota bacterium]
MANSRLDKYNKRRKNTQILTALILIGLVLFVLLIMLLIFKNRDAKDFVKENNNGEINNEFIEDEQDQNNKDDDKSVTENEQLENDDETNNELNEESEEEQMIQMYSDDENVISAFSKNWDPIGTEQNEPHETQFNKQSTDWKEMEQAMKIATELDELIIWWLGNDGDQKAVGTVTSMDQKKIFRVYLSWITNEGWQPTKVEVLQENDMHSD